MNIVIAATHDSVVKNIIKEYLSEFYHLIFTEDIASTMPEEGLDESTFVALIDTRIPKVERMIGKIKSDFSIPVILILEDESGIKKFLSLGFDDFMILPLVKEELLFRVQKEVQVTQLIKDHESKEQRLLRIATKDSVTNLYNRMYLDNFLNLQIEKMQKGHLNVSVIYVKIDRMEHIALNHSLEVEQKVIRDFGRLLQKKAHRGDLVGRITGGNYLIICPKVSSQTAKILISQLQEALRKVTFAGLSVTASFVLTKLEKRDSKEAVYRRIFKKMQGAGHINAVEYV